MHLSSSALLLLWQRKFSRTKEYVSNMFLTFVADLSTGGKLHQLREDSSTNVPRGTRVWVSDLIYCCIPEPLVPTGHEWLRFSPLAQASLSATVRLKTGAPGFESGSTQKYPKRSN